MNKTAWRKHMMQQREQLSTEERLSQTNAIHRQVLEHPQWQEAEHIGLYHSVKHEIDTLSLIRAGWESGQQVYLPRCEPQTKQLRFYRVERFDQLEVVYYGLPEPIPSLCEPLEQNKLELLFVPGLVFNREGYRVGYGGGYYDRFLAGLTFSPVHRIAIAYPFQVVDQPFPVEAHDLPVHSIVTGEKLIWCETLPQEQE